MFIHIPKTAGTSVREFLDSQYSVPAICQANAWSDVDDFEALKSYSLVRGHFTYSLIQDLPPAFLSFTVLRHPLNRMLSSLRHMQRDPQFHSLHERAKDRSISEILRDSTIMNQQRDVQARTLCASNSAEVIVDYVKDRKARGAEIDVGMIESGAVTLELARERLNQINFIGVLEDLDSSIHSLTRAMGFHPRRALGYRNHAPEGPSEYTALSAADIAIMREYNQIDLPLYEYAREAAFERNRLSPPFDQILGEFFTNNPYECPPGSFRIDLAEPIPGSGWYPPEFHSGNAVRWTGPTPFATLELVLPRNQRYIAQLRFIVTDPAILDEFDIFVDGVSVARTQESDNNRTFTVSFAVVGSSDVTANAYTEIILRFSRAIIPAEHGGADLRALGVLVTSIEFSVQVDGPEQPELRAMSVDALAQIPINDP